MRRGKRRASRWLFGWEGYLPGRVRLGFYAASFAVLGATYAATGSEGIQILALFALVFGVLPALSRRFGVPMEYAVPPQDRHPPLGVIAGSLAFAVIWGGLVYLVPDLGLGPWFWFWIVMVPWMEAFRYLLGRRLRRDGGKNWKPVRPWRDAALAGLVIAPFMAVVLLFDGMSVGEAAAWGAGCGAMMFVICRTLIWLEHRGRTPGPEMARDA